MKRLTLPPVLYEDDSLLAIDKPSGMLSEPDRWDKELENLMGLVHAHLSPQYANVHRLDRDTSGLLVCAKTPEALDSLRAAFDTRQVQKTYMALVRPAPHDDRGLIDRPIGPDPRQPGRMRPDPRGKETTTDFEVVQRWRERFALLRVRPHTVRTHQIRVHLAHTGCPVLCDPLYGDGRGLYLSELKRGYKPGAEAERPLIGRLALHAEGLTLPHPTTGQPLTIQAPLPKDFQIALKYLDRFAR